MSQSTFQNISSSSPRQLFGHLNSDLDPRDMKGSCDVSVSCDFDASYDHESFELPQKRRKIDASQVDSAAAFALSSLLDSSKNIIKDILLPFSLHLIKRVPALLSINKKYRFYKKIICMVMV